MKQWCGKRGTAWLGDLDEMRDQTEHIVKDFLAKDAQ